MRISRTDNATLARALNASNSSGTRYYQQYQQKMRLDTIRLRNHVAGWPQAAEAVQQRRLRTIIASPANVRAITDDGSGTAAAVLAAVSRN